MNYRKIKINQNGLKGAELHFIETNERGTPELTKKYPRNPVHLGLQKLFKDLRIHLLQVCQQVNDSMDENILAQLVMETHVDCICFDGDTITIEGEKQVTAEKYITLKTYKIEEEDGYEHYNLLRDLADNICSETTEYLSGNKKVPDSEVIAMWAQMNHKEEEFSMEKILSLPKDQLEKMALTVIEKGLGGVVLMPNDMEDVDPSHLESVVEELKSEFEIGEGNIEIEVPSAPVKKDKKAKEATLQTEPNSPNDNSEDEQF